MRREPAPRAEELRDFAIAARGLALEAALLMRRVGAEEPPAPEARRAVERATEALARLERDAAAGAATGDSCRAAAMAMRAAAEALGEEGAAGAPRLRVVTARPPAVPPGVGGARS